MTPKKMRPIPHHPSGHHNPPIKQFSSLSRGEIRRSTLVKLLSLLILVLLGIVAWHFKIVR